MLDSFFNAQQDESPIYNRWINEGLYRSKTETNQAPFCIMMPPPNVTGNLHIGHALTYTLQDILMRYHRMQGADILWQPGVDHAGISTQMMVERKLASQGISKIDIGRDKFLEHVWAWKNQYGDLIVDQQKKLGILCDWSRHRFTMDPGLSRAVNKLFVQLYNDGLIYKAKRLVNWDPQLLTAVSDLEVNMIEVQGTMTYMRYPLSSGQGYITVATTRPETLFGDAAVAVHPDDERYQSLIGQTVDLPFINRSIPIIADDYVDAAFESGALKITPAHDFNDFEIGKRQGLEMRTVVDQYGKMTQDLPAPYGGLDRFEARKKVIADLDQCGLLVQQKPHQHGVPHGERSGVVLEPRLTDQWFLDVEDLAARALAAVDNNDTQFIPDNQQAIFKHWMNNIQPWCLSRQLWWGHQIPVWYSNNGDMFCAQTHDEALVQAEAKLGSGVQLTQDDDVLDTWFSSALWPFSTLGWPNDTEELARYYPTAVLITGEDILFFWVARMMMMGLYATNKVPFKTVFFNPLVRDEHGQKMSKTKGNVIDPLDVINQYGTDALRFALTSLTSPGRDIRFAISHVEHYRNFITKIWNAAKFCQHNQAHHTIDFDFSRVNHPINQWILSQLNQTYDQVEVALNQYRFDELCTVLYRFIKNTFCDWYIEFSKVIFQDATGDGVAETRQVLGFILKAICQVVHPIMPFVSEKIWHDCIGPQEMLLTQDWRFSTNACANNIDAADLNNSFTHIQDMITKIRGIRKDLNVPITAQITISIQTNDHHLRLTINEIAPFVKRVARITSIEWVTHKPVGHVVQVVMPNVTLYLQLNDVIDIEVEQQRLQNAFRKAQQDMDDITALLSQESFVQKAPQHIIEKNQSRLNSLQEQVDKIQQALKSFM